MIISTLILELIKTTTLTKLMSSKAKRTRLHWFFLFASRILLYGCHGNRLPTSPKQLPIFRYQLVRPLISPSHDYQSPKGDFLVVAVFVNAYRYTFQPITQSFVPLHDITFTRLAFSSQVSLESEMISLHWKKLLKFMQCCF